MGVRIFLISFLFLPLTVNAVETEDDESNQIVVTATRTARTVDETLASVTVIDQDEIENSQAHSVPELLLGIPGLSIANNGGQGKLTSFFLRGTESNHILVLIDGVKVGSATSGTAPIQDIPISQVERIEVVRGPRSSLYGSEAIGGVIQIFTKKGGGKVQPVFSLGAGNYQTTRASVGVSGGGKHSWFNVSASGHDTEGFNSCNGEPLVGGCFTTEPDKDGYQNRSMSVRGGHRFSSGVELDIHGLQTVGKNEYDGGFQNNSDIDRKVYGTSIDYSPVSIWNTRLDFGRSIDYSKNFQGTSFSGDFETARNRNSFQNDLTLFDTDVLTLGVDYQKDHVKSSTDYDVTERDNTGVFAQYQGNFSLVNYNMSARKDDNEQFGEYTTGSAALRFNFIKSLWVSASHGTAFAAPTFNDLYFPLFGNPDLEPEESKTTELALGGQIEKFHWSLHGYKTVVENLIAFDFSTFTIENINSAEITGAELDLGLKLSNWIFKTSYTQLDPVNKSEGANNGNKLARRADQSASLDVQYLSTHFNHGLSVTYSGKAYNDVANTIELDPYTLVGVRTEYAPDDEWKIQFKIDNLLKEKYETAEYYNQPGRTVFLNLKYSPEL